MNHTISEKYNTKAINARVMGPNPIKLQEELLANHILPCGATVMDLGSGQGVTSMVLAKEYGFRVFAADLWSDPTDNMRFFEEMGLSSDRIIPVRADANDLPFAHNFFDAVVCTDSYNFFGRDKNYLGEKLMPFLKQDGRVYISIPGMKKDFPDGNYPEELLLSWTPDQLAYIRDIEFWRETVSAAANAKLISIGEMECNEDIWRDWIVCDNDYARNDKKAVEAGACRYMNFISIVLAKS